MAKHGVDLSLAKTHVSCDTYEFAKRWIKGKCELTPLPIRGIVDNIHNPIIVFSIIFDYMRIKEC